MSAQASYFKLGLFVIVAVSLICGGVIVLGASKLLVSTFTIETAMTDSVEGIGKGSAVKYLGVNLGEVSEVMVSALKYDRSAAQEGHFGSTILVEMAIRQDALKNPSHTELKAWLEKASAGGLRARAAASGFTGPAYIELVFVDPKLYPPPALHWTPSGYYVPSAPSQTQVLLGTVQAVLRKLDAIDIQSVVADSYALVKSANTKLEGLDTKKLSDETVAFLSEVRKSNERLQQILNNPSIDPSLADLRASLENASKATARIQEILADPRVERLMANLDRAGDELPPSLQDVRRAVRRIDRLIESQQATIESALSELNRAMANVRNITDDASENPARILFGDPPPHVKPGAKP